MDTLKPAYLICEKSKGSVYLYMEDKQRYAKNEPKRLEVMDHRLDINILNLECDLSAYADNVYFVFRLNTKHPALPLTD
jgi:hypothetical protein